MGGPDDTKDLVKATAEGVTEGAVRAALEPFVAPIAETGQLVTDLIRFQRWKVQFRILEKATAFLEARGLEPRGVPIKVLVPLLEAASLEDESDEDMQTRWAALLANASAGTLGAPVFASFPDILAQLEPIEARILDELTRRSAENVDVWGLRVALGHDAPEDTVRTAFLAHLGNLERLGLCHVRWQNQDLKNVVTFLRRNNTDGFGGRPITDPPLPRLDERELVTLTMLGQTFVQACTPLTPAV